MANILYIDDEQENLIGFEISFTKIFNIFTADNTIKGYELLNSFEFSVMLIDYKMPNEDGITFIERIKDEFPHLVIIIISGYADLNVVIKAINMNCLYGFIQKPWNYEELKIALNNAVTLFKTKRENQLLLEDLVIKNKQLEKSIARERELNDIKNVFLQNISHEIRTPLNSIIGFAHVANEKTDDIFQKNYYEICINSGYQLLKVMDNIISASMILTNQVKINPKEFNLRILVNQLLDSMKFNGLIKSSLQFENNIEENIYVKSDEDILKSVVDAILDNAFKFTDKGHIKISAESKDIDKVTVKIEDTGIGIDKELLSILYEPFRQGDESSTRKYGGNGLGLFIAKSYIELQGDNIWFESEPLMGSSFYFTLAKGHKRYLSSSD